MHSRTKLYEKWLLPVTSYQQIPLRGLSIRSRTIARNCTWHFFWCLLSGCLRNAAQRPRVLLFTPCVIITGIGRRCVRQKGRRGARRRGARICDIPACNLWLVSEHGWPPKWIYIITKAASGRKRSIFSPRPSPGACAYECFSFSRHEIVCQSVLWHWHTTFIACRVHNGVRFSANNKSNNRAYTGRVRIDKSVCDMRTGKCVN